MPRTRTRGQIWQRQVLDYICIQTLTQHPGGPCGILGSCLLPLTYTSRHIHVSGTQLMCPTTTKPPLSNHSTFPQTLNDCLRCKRRAGSLPAYNGSQNRIAGEISNKVTTQSPAKSVIPCPINILHSMLRNRAVSPNVPHRHAVDRNSKIKKMTKLGQRVTSDTS